ncbi:MAG: HNH endonuclease [Rhizobiaceae bacterium]|nr:HNH endonuclease [Rhizobiaceae bacterium]
MKTIPLTGGGYAIVDDEDYERVSACKWWTQKGKGGCLYAVRSRGQLLHREIMRVGPGQFVDHINRDGLDNRKANLRVCTNAQNMANQAKRKGTSSRYKGVHVTASGKYVATIESAGTILHLGTFREEERAARQYDRAARVFFGNFARTNEMLGLLPLR